MRHSFLIRVFLLIFISTTAGAGSFYYYGVKRYIPILSQPIHANGWFAWPDFGTEKANPYVKLVSTKFRFIPVGQGSLIFVAHADQEGRPLDAQCQYHLSGKTPGSVLWSLTVAPVSDRQNAGRKRDTEPLPARHQKQIVYEAQDPERFGLTASKAVSSGNWLPLPESFSQFVFILRLYETPLLEHIDARAYRGAFPMPVIKRHPGGAC
jgi:hypothetical protein